MPKVYVVIGTTGEYSDHTEWPVISYLDKREARKHVENATRRAKQIEMREDYGHPDRLQNQYDPDMRMDYTGTTYFLWEVDLVGL